MLNSSMFNYGGNPAPTFPPVARTRHEPSTLAQRSPAVPYHVLAPDDPDGHQVQLPCPIGHRI
nr:hypothetical protein [Nostoc sp. EkiNYC01]